MKRLIYIIILLIVGINCSLSSQVSPDHNYIITRTPLDGVADVDNPGNARVLTTIQYYDGLGRPSQSVQKGITPSGADLVTLTEYDGLGRELYTSELTVSGTCESMNSYFNDYVVTETFMDENAEMYPVEDTGYSKGWYHVAPMRLLTVKYYDNYDFLSFSSGYLNYEQRDGYGEPYDNATGLLTGTRTYLLDGSGEYLSAAYYYDSRGRLVQERSTNHMKGYDAVYYQYDFAGNVLQSFKQHYTYDFKMILIEEHYTHTYDHAGRLIETRYQLNDNAETVLVQNEYDELGRLKRKTQHNGSNRVDYEYNIRNWLAKIKDGNLEESLFYCSENRFILMIGATNCYNGNIAQISINHHGTNHTYIYHYDGLNRLVEAKKNPPLQLAPVGGESAYANSDKFSYNETFSYDKHGNITNLLRYAKSREVILPTIQGNPEKTTYMPTIIDNLELEYEGNRIVGINDAVTADALYNRKEYHDLNTSGNDFAYDANGNMLYDLDRDIVTIRYNLLNLPDTVQFRGGSQIENLYAADGRLLQRTHYTPFSTTVVPIGSMVYYESLGPQFYDIERTGYIGNKEYGLPSPYIMPYYYLEPKRVHNGEGYVDVDVDSGADEFYYYRRDHLGNNREVWKATDSGAQTVQRTRYYPSGLPWEYQAGDSASLQPYKYGGKEFVEMHGLDMYDSHARWYDPLTFRTPTPDPLAEKYYSISPYAWCGNNPVNWVDLDGRQILLGGSALNLGIEKITTTILPYTDFNDVWVLGSTVLSGFTEVQPQHINGTPATGEDIEAAKSGLLLPVVSGSAVNEAGKIVDNLLDAGKAGKSLPNPYGAKGKPDHQAAVDMLEQKARDENPGQWILREKKINAENSNRRPDVQVQNSQTGKTIKVYEAERNPNGQRNLKREEEYRQLGIPFETHKVGGH